MSIDLNDPKLTAYALGELDEADRMALEKELKDLDLAQAWVDEVRATANWLEQGFKEEETLQLPGVQKTRLLEEAAEIASKKIVRWPFRWGVPAITLAAAACVVLSVPMAIHQMQNPPASNSKIFATINNKLDVAQAGPSVMTVPSAPTPVPPEPPKEESLSDSSKNEVNGTIVEAPPRADVFKAVPLTAIPATQNMTKQVPASATLSRAGVNGEIGSLVAISKGEALSKDVDRSYAYQFAMDGKKDSIRDANRAVVGGESYSALTENPFVPVAQEPLSTFSLDVDTASYSNVRRFLTQGQLPPKDAVRIEEMINYFPYDYPKPDGDDPFACRLEVAGCPWAPDHRLVRIAVKARPIDFQKAPPSNLVFLIDVSGSMDEPNKLPLVKKGLGMLVQNLREEDRVAIVVYAGNSGLVLPSTRGTDKQKILDAIDHLEAGGSTNGAAGIQLAYQVAEDAFLKKGSNRVILVTDGDFNVGVSSPSELTDLIKEKAKSGVFLTVLGFGMGNYKDETVQKLADNGNGNYAYIDSLQEARKVLVEQMSGTLVTVAKDVKTQVEFNPARVEGYRLIGYEKRLLRKEDFNNDKIDAGEIGAGHTVTALYEVVPVGVPMGSASVDPLKYQKPAPVAPVATSDSNELLTVKLRYKAPQADTSKLLSFSVVDSGRTIQQASRDMKFAVSVAGWGMILRESPYRGNANVDQLIELAQMGKGEDELGYRSEFIQLLRLTKQVVSPVKLMDRD